MLWPEKNSYKEFDNEKKFLRLENSPPPPHNFSNGPSLPDESSICHYKMTEMISSTSAHLIDHSEDVAFELV